MFEAMRQLSLDFLFKELGCGAHPDNLEAWFRNLRYQHPEQLFKFLVEDPEKVKEVYIIEPSPDDPNTASLSSKDMTSGLALYLPFMRPTGPQGAQIGPVIKRSYSKEKGAGPSTKILKTTRESFREISQSNKPWADYFRELLYLFERPKLRLPDQSEVVWLNKGFPSLLDAAVHLIGEKKGTVFLTATDVDGKLPGQCHEYLDYLLKEKLAGDRYVTQKALAQECARCALCGADGVTVYPNAIKGAGINFGNMDREGAFPGVDVANAWKGYALCGNCSDLLYIYKYHVINQDAVSKRRPFTAPVAGDPALIIPYSNATPQVRQKLLTAVEDFVKNVPTDVQEDEITLLDILKDQRTLLSLTFLWADVGQNIEEVRGVITDVPPSRLRELSEHNEQACTWRYPLFPEMFLRELKPSLSLSAIRSLFKRPGGKKSQGANDSRRLFHLRRLIAASVYHGDPLPDKRFWEEVTTTARWYWQDAVDAGNAYGLLNEGEGKKGPYLTAAGWVRHLAWWLYYFRKLGVMKMPGRSFEPVLTELKPYFGPESGIDNQQKAFAFLLGVLYGKLLQVQGARKVNVSANALTWLKRLTLTGRDLPPLYVKIREKLLAYETERSPQVRALIEEIGGLGVRLGDAIELDDTATCYYLLLGQSLSNRILRKDEDKDQDGGSHD